MRASILGAVALVATLAASSAMAQVVVYPAPAPVVTYSPVLPAPTVTYSPVVPATAVEPVTTYRPANEVITYSPVVTPAPVPVTTYYAPAPVTTYYAPAPVVTYSPVVTAYGPVVAAPVVVGRPAYARTKVYYPGQPVRNFFRAVTP
jgi:hypothetical protein